MTGQVVPSRFRVLHLKIAYFLFGLPAIAHQLLALGMTLVGQYWVGKMLGLGDAGIYATALKFAVPLTFAIGAVQNAWTPFKYQIHANDEDPAAFFRTAVTYYVAALLYLWVGVSIWGPELVWLMTEKAYWPAAGLIAITGLIPVSQGIFFMLGTGMELGRDIRPFPLISFAGLVTVIVSVFWLVPRIGPAGAAIASVNSFIVLAVMVYYFSQRRFRVAYDWQTLILLGVLAAVTVVASRQTMAWPVSMRLMLTIAMSLLFPCFEFLVLSRSQTERHRMRILWEKLIRLTRAAKRLRASPHDLVAGKVDYGCCEARGLGPGRGLLVR